MLFTPNTNAPPEKAVRFFISDYYEINRLNMIDCR